MVQKDIAAAIVKDNTANPAPLGLTAFGLTTVLLNLHNSGVYGLSPMVLAMGIFYGGIAQVIAGIFEWKKGNTFGSTAFTSYGLFWLSLVGLWLMPKIGWWDVPADNNAAMISYFFMWGIFTLIMFIGTLKLNGALQFVFCSLAILFFLLAIRDITGNPVIAMVTGIEGIICGLSAVYAGLAQVLNEVYGRDMLPLWPVKK